MPNPEFIEVKLSERKVNPPMSSSNLRRYSLERKSLDFAALHIPPSTKQQPSLNPSQMFRPARISIHRREISEQNYTSRPKQKSTRSLSSSASRDLRTADNLLLVTKAMT